jgi:hypothetical protein
VMFKLKGGDEKTRDLHLLYRSNGVEEETWEVNLNSLRGRIVLLMLVDSPARIVSNCGDVACLHVENYH